MQARDRSGPRWTRTANPHQSAHLNCKLQARDCSGPRRTRTANPGSVCSPPDLNCKLVIAVVPAGPQPQRISEDIPDRMQEKMSEDMPDTFARKNVR